MHKRLRIVSYDDYSGYDKVYKERYQSTASYVTNLSMYPFSLQTETRVLEKSYNIFYVTIPDMLPLIEKIITNSNELMKLSEEIPPVAQNKLILTQLIEEIQSSNDIEGVKSTRKEINEAIQFKKSSGMRFSGIVTMYKAIMENKEIRINSIKNFRDIYDKLVLTEIEEKDKPDGELFRKDVVYVKAGDKKFHQGDPSELTIVENLNKLIEFMNLSDISFIIKSIITHYYFEYIHPFYDGNGRMGRFLMSMYLGRKLDVYTGLSVSQGVLDNKTKYEKAFTEVSHPKNNGEVTHFIIDMMKIIIDGQEKIRKSMSLLERQLYTAKTYIENKDWDEHKSSIIFLFFQNHLFEMTERLLSNEEIHSDYNPNNLSRRKIDAITKELEDEGLLSKVKKRPIVYDLTDKAMRVVE